MVFFIPFFLPGGDHRGRIAVEGIPAARASGEGDSFRYRQDALVVEEPMEIRSGLSPAKEPVPISVTMRTPATISNWRPAFSSPKGL